MADILLAEDDAAISRILVTWLEHEGHRVALVENGLGGIRSITLERAPDLLVTDLMMPEVNGDELITMVRTLLPQTPIVVVTGLGDERRLHEIEQEDGVRRVLRKPVSREGFVNAVQMALAS